MQQDQHKDTNEDMNNEDQIISIKEPDKETSFPDKNDSTDDIKEEVPDQEKKTSEKPLQVLQIPNTKSKKNVENNLNATEQHEENDDSKTKKKTEKELSPEELAKRRRRRYQKMMKKKRQQKVRKIIIGIVTLIVLLSLIVVFGFRTKQVIIEGNQRISDDEIKKIIHVDESAGNSILLWLMNRKVNISEYELLADVKVLMTNPSTICAVVEEEAIVGSVKVGDQYLYFNKNGLVLISQSQKIENVPVFEGLEIVDASLKNYLNVSQNAELNDMLTIGDWLNHYEVYADSIGHSDIGYVAYLNKVRVQLGENIYMEEKISELKDLYEKIKNLSGVLHLENYDSTKDSIIFTKDS